MPPARAAATLLLIYPGPDGELTIPLTLRHADLRSHAGEVSLPGGTVDPTDASPTAAALREAWEELGIPPDVVRVAGSLDAIWIPVSNFELRTIVGTAAERPELRAHADEVASVLELPLRMVLAEDAITDELIEGAGWQFQAGVYRFAEERIWGATARSLAMLATVLASAAVD
jgi:8-oxo-dGTP pyrophosphatase MutT (NUDIX family)